jgi:hypothetical protein
MGLTIDLPKISQSKGKPMDFFPKVLDFFLLITNFDFWFAVEIF